MVLWLALPVLVAALPEHGGQDTLQELKERARAAKPEDATLANIRVAREEIEVADQHYTNGDVEQGRTAVDEAAHYAELGGQAVSKDSKHLKQAEIILREAGRRLEDIRRSLAFDDQPPVKKAVERLEKVRRILLTQMFAPPPK